MTLKKDTKFEEESIFISNLTEGVWKILTWALESLKNVNFNGLLLSRVYIIWAKRVEESSFMTLKSDAKFEKLTCGLENDMNNLTSFHQSTQKCQNWEFDGIQSRKSMSLKLIEDLCVMIMKNDSKIEKNLNCLFRTDKRNLTNFDLSTWKSNKFVF